MSFLPVTPAAALASTSGIRDLYLGRLHLVTYDDSFQEAVGDELILSGAVAALGARKPKRYAMTLPLHGTPTDGDPYAAGQRMRRQVRSLTENALARSQGLYLYSFADPEQNGWLMLGSGTIAYADGGVTLAEYTLTLDEVYRVASDRAYRPARRLEIYDRRLSTTPRDYLGGVYRTDFAALTGGTYASSSWFAWLPPGVADVTGLGRTYVTPYPVFSMEGNLSVVTGQVNGTVLSYEQPPSMRQAGDVVIYDRRGQGDWTPPYVNLVTNPSFEGGAAGWASATTARINAGASISYTTNQAYAGATSLEVQTTATNHEGADFGSIPVVSGRPYTATVFVRGDAGGEQVQLMLGDGTVGSATSGSVTLAQSWQALTVTLTPTASGTTGLAVRTTAATAWTFYVDGVIVTQTSDQVAYFDGSSPGCSWTGAAHASTSQGPWGWENAVRNPSFSGGTASWALTASGGVLSSALSEVPDAATPPGDAAEVSLSGVTGSTLAPTSAALPSSIAGLVAWYKADAISGVANGAAVATWPDSSGNGRDATQSTSGNRPLYATAAANGQPAVTFDGSNDFLQATVPETDQPATIIAVVKVTTNQDGNYLSLSSAGDIRAEWNASAPEGPQTYAGTSLNFSSPSSLNTWIYVTSVLSGASSALRLNGVQVASGNVGSNAGGTVLRLGQNGSGGQLFAGQIAEAMVFSSALTPSQRRDVEAYLAQKYALGTTLPSFDDVLPVAPSDVVYCEAWVKLVAALPAGATLTVAPLFYTPSGGVVSAGAAPADAQIGSSAKVGSWYRLFGTWAVPAGAYLALPSLSSAGHSTGATIHYRADDFLVTDVSALGLPPTYNPAAAPNARYFDGCSPRSGWQEAAGASASVLWLDPQDAAGWEECYGPEHPLTSGDIPVLSNGVCRVRAEQGAPSGTSDYLAVALDVAAAPVGLGGGGWQEVGRFSFGPPNATPATPSLLWSHLEAVSISEWTPERAVVRASFSGITVLGSGPYRFDLYISLQRGWSAPRFEVYASPSPTALCVFWASADPANQVAVSTRVDGIYNGVAASSLEGASGPAGGGLGASGKMEPWIAVHSLANAVPVVYLIREWDASQASWTVSTPGGPVLYPSGSHARTTLTLQGAAAASYYSCQLAVGLPGVAYEAEAIRNLSSGTTGTASDSAALSTPATPTVFTSTTGGALPTATAYRYRIVAYDAIGTTAAGAVSSSVTTGAGSTNSNTVTWPGISGATGYLVLRQTGGSGSYYLIGTTTSAGYVDGSSAQSATVTATNYATNTTGQTSSGGQFVTETQTAITNATLTTPATSLGPLIPIAGVYGIWARVRALPGDVINLQGAGSGPVVANGSIPAAGPISVTSQSSAWQWVYIGEGTVLDPHLSRSVYAWITRAAQNPTTSSVATDLIAIVPTTRPGAVGGTFDGARDQAALALTDTRAVAEVVQR